MRHHIAIERRILREIFSHLGIIGEGSNFRQIESLRNFISTFHPGQKLNLAKGYTVNGSYGHIFITSLRGAIARAQQSKACPKGTKQSLKMNIPGETLIKDLSIKVVARFSKKIPSPGEMRRSFPGKVFLDAKQIKLPLYLRTRRPGDFFEPLGMKGSIKIKKYFINTKIPQERRKFIPLVVSGREIIWVVGCAISDRVKVTPRTKNILMLRKNHLP